MTNFVSDYQLVDELMIAFKILVSLNCILADDLPENNSHNLDGSEFTVPLKWLHKSITAHG